MKKWLTFIALAVTLALLFWAGNAASKKNRIATVQNEVAVEGLPRQAEAFLVSPASYDFGTISMKRGKVSQAFVLHNAGEQPVTIRKITTSCMCTEAFITQDEIRKGPFGMPGHGSVPPVNEVVPPQGTTTIDVVYDPAAHGPAGIGRIERAVFVEDDNGNVQVLTIKALVTP